MERECGGCQGMGSHWRWCPNVVGAQASRRGVWSMKADALADEVGANCPEAANALYTASALLEAAARNSPAGEVTPPDEGATLVGSPWTNADSRELAEVLHAERHSGTFVPTLDSCLVDGCRDEALRLAGVVTPPAEQRAEPCPSCDRDLSYPGAPGHECYTYAEHAARTAAAGPVAPPAEQRHEPCPDCGWSERDCGCDECTARPTTEGGHPMMAWRCEAHGVVTRGDCPKCDDELIALTNEDARPNA